jgi:hypothetical protein
MGVVGVGAESLSGSSFCSVMGATPRICPNFMMAVSYRKMNENFPMFSVSENDLEPMGKDTISSSEKKSENGVSI